MYNVIIVDDEPVIRFGLKASIDWDKENLNMIGDFRNGEEALQSTEKERVDILITDIKMPVMDGLELMKRMQERNPEVKVILVSSYTDFEFVQEGLRYGAIDYILKPTMKPEDFLKVIQKCVEALDHDQLVKEKIKLADQSVALTERKKVEEEVKKIILGQRQSLHLESFIHWKDRQLMVVTICVVGLDELEKRSNFLNKTLLIEELQQYFYEYTNNGICFPVEEDQLMAVFRVVMNEALFFKRLKNNLEDEMDLTLVFSYALIDHVDQLKEGYIKSQQAKMRYFFNQTSHVFRYEEMEEKGLPPLDIDLLHSLILPYEEKKLMYYIDQRATDWEKTHDEKEVKKDACEILQQVFLQRLNAERILQKCEQIMQTETIDVLKETLKNLADEALQWIQKNRSISPEEDKFMQKALQYIHNHYTENVTLEAVAKHIHMSPNYFSVKFKNDIGVNFIDYIIDLRIRKAKELLQHTNLKVYEIAHEAGFNDVKYFSKLFRRIVDHSPTEYRTKKRKTNST